MFIITRVKQQHSIAVADEKQVKEFMTNPNLAIDGAVWVIKGEKGLVEEFSKQEMIALYNNLNGSALKKFKDKVSGAERTYPLIKERAVQYSDFISTKNRAVRSRAKGTIHLDAQPTTKTVYPCRMGTKQAALVDALKEGATMKELVEVCSKVNGGKNWTETSVKSGIYWDVNKIKGYGVRTETNNNGQARYFLTYPAGMKTPLPHTPLRKS